MRRIAVVVGLLIACGAGASASPLSMNIQASGQNGIMIIDFNGDDILGNDDDCTFGATTDGSNLTLTPDGGSQLRVCQGECFGFGFVDSSDAGTSITECNWGSLSPGAPFVPACMEFSSSVPDSSPSFCSNTAQAPGGQGQGDGPLDVRAGRLFYPGFEFLIPEPGSGFLCEAGGPAVQITTISGRIVVTDITFLGDPPTHACVKVPFELINGSKVLLNSCVPVNSSGNIDFALEGEDPFATVTLFDSNPPCAGRTSAPTVTDFGLVLLALGLLGMGAWTLGRRSGFARSLPLL